MVFVPKVTVLMPVYNGELFLCQAIDSILQQTFSDFEFLIINDGSWDNSVEIIASYDDPRIRVVTNKKNLNLRVTLNKGLKLARGQYIARMDCDDVSFPERLARQISFMETHPSIGVLGSAVYIINSQGKLLGKTQFPKEHHLIHWALSFYCPMVHPTVMMRKDLIVNEGGYNTEMAHAEDYDLWCRLIRKTRFANLEDGLLGLRKHHHNISEIHSSVHLQMVLNVHRKHLHEELGENLTFPELEGIRFRQFESFLQQWETANLILRLYRNWENRGGLEAPEKKKVKEDAAFRLFLIAVSRMYDFRIWRIVILACRLDFLVPGRFIGFLFSRAMQYCRYHTLPCLSPTPDFEITKRFKGEVMDSHKCFYR